MDGTSSNDTTTDGTSSNVSASNSSTSNGSTCNGSTSNDSTSNGLNGDLTLNSNENSGGSVGGGFCLVANLSGNLVGHSLAHLPWDGGASLSGDLEGHLLGNLGALLPGDGVACLLGDIVALLLWHAVALLLGDAVALLLGHIVAHLLWHAVAHLLGDIIADGLGNSPGGVDALGLGNLGALWARNQTGLLDGLLVADTLGMGHTPAGTSKDLTSEKTWLSISITLAKMSMSESPHSSQSMDTSKGSSTGDSTSSNSTSGDNTSSDSTSSNSTMGDSTTGDNTTRNHTTSNNIALNSNQSSPGLSAGLGGDVMALFNDGSINNLVRFSDAVLASGGSTLLVGHLLDNVFADLLGFSVAYLLRFGVAFFLGHGVANLFGHGVADLLLDGVADLLIDSVADLVVPGFADVVELSLELGLGDSFAHLLWDGSTLLGGGHIVDSLTDGSGHSDSWGSNGWGNCSPGNGRGTQSQPAISSGSSKCVSVSISAIP